MPATPPATLPEVAIIILNWNGGRDTIECLDSVFQLNYRPLDIIVVDNGSTDTSVETIRGYCSGTIEVSSPLSPQVRQAAPVPCIDFSADEAMDEQIIRSRLPASLEKRSVILIQSPENSGYAKGNNLGIRFALRALSPDYILILNNDVIITDSSLLYRLVSHCEQDPGIGVITPLIRSPDGSIERTCTRSLPVFADFLFVHSFLGQKIFRENRIWKRYYHHNYSFDAPGEFDVISGAFMLFRSDALQEIGLFDEETFLYWEEHIAGWKLKDCGWKSVLFPQAAVIHKGESTINTFNLKSWARYWSIRSEFVFIAKYSRLNVLERGIITTTLAFEACLALLLASLRPGRKEYDAHCELRILKFLLLHR
jgi:GT2 family glycosyltransferase